MRRCFSGPARLLCCVLLACFCLAGCVERNMLPRPAGVFPDKPVGVLIKTPEQVFAGKTTQKNLSFKGGWGYKRDDAFTIASPAGSSRKNPATVPLELLLIHARNKVEFTETPPEGRRYTVVDYGTDSRTLSTREGRMYAVWKGLVSIAPEGAGRNEARMVPREYWFDISEFYARDLALSVRK